MAKSFHCDNCGEAVSPDEVRCPRCGRYFRAVRCPVCSYTGQGREFLKGCPVCGYLGDNYSTEQVDEKRKKHGEFLNISRIFAYSAIAVLSILLVYFLYLLVRT